MAEKQNAAVQERLAELINAGSIDDLDQVFAKEVKDHDPAPDQGPGAEGFKGFFNSLLSAFPDLKVSPEVVVSDEEHVAIAYTITGTHKGDFLGVAPTGKAVVARGMQISRIEGDKIAERWGSSDELGILKQLGADVSA